ncbi:MAG: hypothetical protein WCI73_06290 [Phycisphaerae bacterium]
MRFNKSLISVLLLAAIGSAPVFMGGCSSLGFGTTSTAGAVLTPEQNLVKQERSVRLAATLATKAALISMDSTKTKSTATLVNTIAQGLLATTI